MDPSPCTLPAEERLTTVGLLFESAAGLRRLFTRELENAGPASGQSFEILIRLARTEGGELRMSELATQASLTPSGLTRAVDRLQQQGLVSRRTCPEDRRGSFAQLTPAGHDLMDGVIPEHLANVGRVLDELFTPEEEAQLSEALRRLRDYALVRNLAAGCDEAADAGACPGA
jgi:MarR family transcriptional regulator, 2-MHQ and catechol-resistance regulon repressor